MNPFFATDGYKVGHHRQYPKGTVKVYSNFTPRSLKHAPEGVKQIVSIGQQMMMRFIVELFDEHFFSEPVTVCEDIKEEYSLYLNTDYDVTHIEELWSLGYLPIKVKALPEGTLVNPGIPVLTITNTEDAQFWLPNFLETLLSNLLWKMMTSATIALKYKKLMLKYAKKTDPNNIGFVDYQGHDFSMRGLDSLFAAMSSGLGHASLFIGSDSIPTIHAARKYYDATELIVASVNATEHSVMSAGGAENELETIRYLMRQFPTGPLSIVSDTWDLWHVIELLPQLKKEILARDGKIVIRPDSGDPVDIICGWGSKITPINSPAVCALHECEAPEWKGVIELLWEIFGGTVNDEGYKVLDPHIGAIYGDAITPERAQDIFTRLEVKGFASTNVVLGIGSYTYQYNTRDTFGFAMKATYCEIEKNWEARERAKNNNGIYTSHIEGKEIYKDPITDNNVKKSAKGLLCVDQIDGEYVLRDQVTLAEEAGGALHLIFQDGTFFNTVTFTEIRKRLFTIAEEQS